MLNQITIMGRLTKDVELRYTQTQTPVASFTIACERDFAERGQEKQTDFLNCVAWRKTAEFAHQYFSKGSMAIVTGRLQTRKWEDRDGNKHTEYEVIADNVYFGESKKKDETPKENKPTFEQLPETDGELPF